MKHWITLCVVATAGFGCVQRQSSEQDRRDKITISCMIVRWEPGFVDSFGWTADPPVLNDIETFFLIDHPAGTKSTPLEFGADEAARLTDTFGSEHDDEYVFATGAVSNGTTRLTISSAEGSKIRLDDEVTVELPKFGSAIIKTANRLRDDRYTYLWVMARQ